MAGRWALIGVTMVFAAPLGAAVSGGVEQVARGEYLYRAGGCASCHTAKQGSENAGGDALTTPFGTFYAPNITPDELTGIGRWRDADFVRAMRDGVSPSGSHYYPAFPYTSYTRIHDDDLRALKAYLFSRPAIARPNRPHALSWYVRFRPLLAGWKAFFFERGPFVTDPSQSPEWNRGAYLATGAAHCGECHTPRGALGGFKKRLAFAGTANGPENTVVPNITPDKNTGIGSWRVGDLSGYLETGMTPDGDFAGDLMADVIDNGLKYLTEADRRAIAVFVRSLPPLVHAVRQPKKKETKEFEY